MMAGFDIQPLGSQHDRAAFSCGETSLDDFLKTKARKEHELNLSVPFVASPKDAPTVVAGYYTLSSLSIEMLGIPAELRKKFPKYPLVPATLLGRLARSTDFSAVRLGEWLLLDALHRALLATETVGSYAVVVDPLNDAAAAFYTLYGFLRFGEGPRQYLPMATIENLGLG
ncbi:MAG: GNAT family N-acetyltransferase [Caulobacter sp.]|nr:GNAT family N-acetyltransferase [Caulobacter sp.]